MSQLAPNFDRSEAACRDGTPLPDELVPAATETALELQVLRDDVDCAIVVTCWYRTAEHNARVKAKETSQHRTGRAVDFRIAGMTPQQVYERVLFLIQAGEMRDGGVGLYPPRKRRLFPPRKARLGFVHYDTGRPGRRWRG
jgi:uncharacterized protein YcbK (DUF882 family)